MMSIQDIVSLLRRKPEAMSLAEEKIYEIVAAEIASKDMRPGVYAKAFSESNGDISKATAIYISYRVKQIKHDIRILMQESRREPASQGTPEAQNQQKSPRTWTVPDDKDFTSRKSEAQGLLDQPLSTDSCGRGVIEGSSLRLTHR